MYFWTMTKIVLIGSGNLAFHFYNQISSCQSMSLVQWYSRKLENINFAKDQVKITDQLSQLLAADLYLICVSDDAVEEVSKKIKTRELIVHCSGALSINSLQGYSRKAVLYPLQSFSKDQRLSFDQVPFCIESQNPKDQDLLTQIAKSLGGIPHFIDSQKRAVIHLIAVMMNNFGNHLMHLGQGLSEEHKIPFSIFHPLLFQTYQKAIDQGPRNSQTGPAQRHDQKTIEKHLRLLKDQNLKKLYNLLTYSIQKKHEQ
jgi:predicted short-subunit dehydrogenase-like oxidoreductase (DUF2520 family)